MLSIMQLCVDRVFTPKPTYSDRLAELVEIHTKNMQERPRITVMPGGRSWRCRGGGLRGYGMTVNEAWGSWAAARAKYDQGFQHQMTFMALRY